MALFDMDGTAVRYENSSFHSSWDALGIAADVENEWNKLLKHYYPKPELYEEWFEKNCKCLIGKEVNKITNQIFPPPYAPGFVDFVHYLNQEKIITGIISSGIDLVAERIKNEVSLDFVVANEIHTDNGYFSGTGQIHVPLWDKGKIVKKIREEHGMDLKETAFFGDNKNDISAWQEVGLRVGINLKGNECYKAVQGYFQDFVRIDSYLERLMDE